jgi:outer membrane protein assembly factor BamB
MAVDLGGHGDVTDSHVRWSYTKQVAQIPSVLVLGGILYMAQDGGVFTSFDADTGQQLQRGRLPAAGQYYASPVAGDGKVYVVNTEGQTSVIRTGATWEVRSTGQLGERVWATPAIGRGRIYVRGEKSLWCFGSPGGPRGE